jgi:AraC-like DNA-binding protein
MQTLSPTDISTNLVIANEAEDYAASIPGFNIKVTRTGRGTGPNVTRTTTLGNVLFSSGAIQFPMVGTATVGENTVLINVITSAPPSSRWCGLDLEPGTVMLYGPGAPHTGISPAGLGFSFVAADVQAIEETADRLELTLDLPDRGQVRTFNPTPQVRSLTRMLSFASDPLDSVEFVEMHHLDALHAAIVTLSTEDPMQEAGAGAKIDSRRLVHVCIEYAEAIEREPTISEMCRAAHVSERRLRDAFTEAFGIPPSRYFRYRSLAHARRTLTGAATPPRTVSGIASDLGFRNFGRFASQYNMTYGELPSATLTAR